MENGDTGPILWHEQEHYLCSKVNNSTLAIEEKISNPKGKKGLLNLLYLIS